jgi:hypothetical protein
MTDSNKKSDKRPLHEDIEKREDIFPSLPATDSPRPPGGGYIQNQGGDWEDPPPPPRDRDE